MRTWLRNGESIEEDLLDEVMYLERGVIERTNTWMDSLGAILCRFDTTVSNWKSWNYMIFVVVFKKFTNQKSLDDFEIIGLRIQIL